MPSKRNLILAGIGIAAALGLLLFFPSTKTVTILLEDQPITITTSADTVDQVLAEAGFKLGPADEVDPAPNRRVSDGDTITLTQAMEVTLWEADEAVTIFTTQRIPLVWLAQAEIDLEEDDQLWVSGMPVPLEIEVPFQRQVTGEVKRAVTITLQSDGQSWTIRSAAPSLGQALWENGFRLTVSDVLTPGPETHLASNLSAQLLQGQQIQIHSDGKTISTTTAKTTVGEALAQSGLALQGLDYSIPDENAPLPSDGLIQVVRVVENVVINQETIPFQTLFQPLDDVEIDNYKVAQLGQVGIQAQRVRVRYEDGEEASREVGDQWTLREPVSRIEGYGTKIVVRTENTPDGPIEYWRKVQMYATSYSPCNSAADRCYPYTSLGLPVQQGVVAVIYDWFIPMGNHTVYVPGYGHAIIADVGGGIPGRHWIDLGYTDEDWIPWAQWVTVYFTTPIPPAHEILYVLPYK
jgi:uncharacterized protein YabE (DUF348 family)